MNNTNKTKTILTDKNGEIIGKAFAGGMQAFAEHLAKSQRFRIQVQNGSVILHRLNAKTTVGNWLKEISVVDGWSESNVGTWCDAVKFLAGYSAVNAREVSRDELAALRLEKSRNGSKRAVAEGKAFVKVMEAKIDAIKNTPTAAKTFLEKMEAQHNRETAGKWDCTPYSHGWNKN